MKKRRADKARTASNTTPDARPGSNATQASLYVRFALSQLGGNNAHHEFEQLCFQLARRRIYSNLIPATGPVSAGGDQGSDFESYHVGEVMPMSAKSPFFGRIAREKVIFACSLEENVQAKVKDDLQSASQFLEKVERVVFLTNRDVPVGRRHQLQEFAHQTYGISLEVFDARAISDWLVEPELFWIAQQYLSISSDFVLAVPKSSHLWYEQIVSSNIDAGHATESEFYRLKDAVRFATHDAVYRSDLPGLLAQLRLFRSHRSIQIQRRAFYEDFVASLRGLEDVRGLETGLQQYLSVVAGSADTSELEDGAVIVGYAVGAAARGLLETEPSILADWRRTLLTRVEELVGEVGIGSGRKCSLLSTQGFLELFDFIDDTAAGRKAAPGAKKAVAVWQTMMKEVRGAPLFPLERFGRLLSQIAGAIVSDEGFSRLVQKTDKLLADRFGRHKLAEQAFARAQSYYEAGKILEAIEELHKARTLSFTEERARDSVQFCIFLTKMYSQIGLQFAAKWYGFGAAFAALKVDDDELRAVAYRGLSEAAASDYASGASMEFFLTAKIFLLVAREFSMAGSERTKAFERSRIDFYSLILTRSASYLHQALHQYLKGTVLKALGTDEVYNDSKSRLDEFFRPEGFPSIVERTRLEGLLPPFSDAGPRRRVGWQQLGASWFVEWKNDYQTARAAESFCATLQILLEDLREVELSLLPSEVSLSIGLHDGALEITDDSDNQRLSLNVLLPQRADTTSKVPETAVLVQGVAASALRLLSAMPQEEFLQLYKRRAKAGLFNKLSPYAEYDRLFREFYSEADYNEHYDHSRGLVMELPKVVARTNPRLRGPSGLHPSYDKAKSERLIRRRYQVLPGQVRYTLPRLERDASFLSAVSELRRQGWKDWHILQAIASVRLNYILNTTLSRSSGIAEFKKAAKLLYDRDEEESDPGAPVELFTVAALNQALVMTKFSTLMGLGFEQPQRTPNFDGVDRFLQRFNYWTDDVPHPKILPDW